MDPISLIPLIAIGSQFLGSLFGSNQTQKENSTTVTTGSSLQNATSSQSQTTSQSGSQNSDSTSNQSSTQQQNGTQVGQTNRLDAGTKSLLTQKVQELMGSIGGGTNQALSELKTNEFNPTAFVDGIMKSATAQAQGDFESNANKIKMNTGAAADTNSAAALLENKIRGDMTSNLAGIRATAEGKAAEITQNRAQALTSIGAAQGQDFNTLLTSLLNSGEQTTQQSAQSVNGSTSGNTSTDTTSSALTQADTTGSQKTATNQAQTEIAAGVTKKNSQDWTNLFQTIGKAFGATF